MSALLSEIGDRPWFIAAFFINVSLTAYATLVTIAAFWLRHARRHASRAGFQPGITILKPLCGVDEELEQNLESFAALDYEPLQIICCTQDAHDPALRIARRIAAKYPHRDIQILSGGESNAASPKVANLEAMWPHVRHDFVLLSDSNVRVLPGDLRELVQPFEDPAVGLVYQPITGLEEVTAAAAMENLRFTEYSGLLTMAVKAVADQDPVTGKGMLFRRSALEDIDVFAHVRDCGAEDYVLSQRLRAAGWRLHLSHVPARTIHPCWSWKSHIRRHLRHGCMRFRLSPWTYPLELVISPVACALLLLPAAGIPGIALLLGTLVVKVLCEAAAQSAIRGRPYQFRHLLMIPVKDLLMLGIWFAAIFYNRVEWRGREYRMTWGSRLIPLAPPRSRRIGRKLFPARVGAR